MTVFKRIIAAMIAALVIFALAGCAGKEAKTEETDTASAAGEESFAPADTEESVSHGVLVSATYSCAGGAMPEEDFSYIMTEKDTGVYVFKAAYYDEEGEKQETEKEVTVDEMNSLRAIFDKYGYEKLVGQRLEPDLGDDDEYALDAPSYYLSGTYADGKSFSTDSAGEGAAELRSFFEGLR